MYALSNRQHDIYELLQAKRSLQVEEIEAGFAISVATAYRDMNALVTAGLAVKTTGGIRLAQPVDTKASDERCFFCGGSIKKRSMFVVQGPDGSQNKACCPHCGLLALDQTDAQAAFSSDFLYGRLVNARQAFFLIGSRVSLCCEPSVLCFANEEDALGFQAGFGGEVCDLPQALTRLKDMVHLGSVNERNASDTP